jgi:periplasmic divalent cation tolerance protein
MRAMDSARIALITAPDREVAQALAVALVEARLAACVNLVSGVESIYRWQGRVERASEVLLLVKTTRERVTAIEALLARQHPYEVPELIALEPAHVEEKYRRWLEDACRAGEA